MYYTRVLFVDSSLVFLLPGTKESKISGRVVKLVTDRKALFPWPWGWEVSRVETSPYAKYVEDLPTAKPIVLSVSDLLIM